MPSFKNQVLDHCIALTDKYEGWVWEKSQRRWRYNPFPGVKICFRMGFTFKYGMMCGTSPELVVFLKEHNDLLKDIGLPSAKNRAWAFLPRKYFDNIPFGISFWSEFNQSVQRREGEGEYDLTEVPQVVAWLFDAALQIIEREFDFSSRDAFVKSMIIADDDPRIDDPDTMHQVGIFNQSILRIMQGDFDFARNADARYPKNGGFFRQDIPIVLDYFEKQARS